MEFDIGNILYIVITLVAVIIGLLGKKKKPAGSGSGTPEKQAKPGFFENLEKVLQMQQPTPEVTNLQEYEEDIQVETPVREGLVEEKSGMEAMNRPSILEEYERIMNSGTEGDTDIYMIEEDVLSGELEVLDMDHETGTDYFEIVKDFDAGTAVVYSAIINRRDY